MTVRVGLRSSTSGPYRVSPTGEPQLAWRLASGSPRRLPALRRGDRAAAPRGRLPRRASNPPVRGGIAVGALRELEEVDHQLKRIRRPRRGGLSEGDQLCSPTICSARHESRRRRGVCTVTRVEEDGASTLYCVGGDSLPGGQINTAGLVTYGADEEFREEPYFFAITGGTGKYRTAHGEVRIQNSAHPNCWTSHSGSSSSKG
jgi:hypothetical protein